MCIIKYFENDWNILKSKKKKKKKKGILCFGHFSSENYISDNKVYIGGS